MPLSGGGIEAALAALAQQPAAEIDLEGLLSLPRRRARTLIDRLAAVPVPLEVRDRIFVAALALTPKPESDECGVWRSVVVCLAAAAAETDTDAEDLATAIATRARKLKISDCGRGALVTEIRRAAVSTASAMSATPVGQATVVRTVWPDAPGPESAVIPPGYAATAEALVLSGGDAPAVAPMLLTGLETNGETGQVTVEVAYRGTTGQWVRRSVPRRTVLDARQIEAGQAVLLLPSVGTVGTPFSSFF